MKQANKNSWQDQFEMQRHIRRCVIVHGNVNDVFFDSLNQRGVSIIRCLEDIFVNRKNRNGFGHEVVHWNPVQGAIPVGSNAKSELERDIRRVTFGDSGGAPQPSGSTAYDFGDDSGGSTVDIGAATQKPESFFQILLNRFSGPRPESRPTAYIIDGADSLFGAANSLSQAERQWLLLIGAAIRDAPCDMNPQALDSSADVIVLVTSRLAAIPSRFYQDNSAVSDIYVPLPNHNEREAFLDQTIENIWTTDPLFQKGREFQDFVDSLEGFTRRDMYELIRLSHVHSQLTSRKLVNLFRYRKTFSHWEDLNMERILQLPQTLGNSVKGQDHVIERVNKVVRTACAGLSGLQHSGRQQMPKGILFFVGPTGVGKTEMAKSLANFLFGDEEACLRFDMSEYNHEHSDQRLIGAPPGYTGYEEGGQLTNAIKRRPFSVILFDEIEKAHGKILDKFLQILEDGRLTDGKGETVSFGESIIIFTSNIGAKDVEPNAPDAQEQFVDQVKRHFTENLGRPELLNRIGERNIVPFNFLTDDNVLIEIAKVKVVPLEEKLKERYGLKLRFDDKTRVLSGLLDGYDRRNGGRGLGAQLSDLIIEPIAREIMETNEPLNGRTVVLSRPDKTIRIRIE